jgi:hypothetical protein
MHVKARDVYTLADASDEVIFTGVRSGSRIATTIRRFALSGAAVAAVPCLALQLGESKKQQAALGG